ncbi:MAG: thioredoxin family protein [Alphaproteobacteria bacterium]|nr:thioredoxin family protein [Alphaproteobacteria bacterium]
MWIRIFLICCWACSASFSWAQSTFSTPQVRAELLWHAPQGVSGGQDLWLGLRLRHQKDWHTYWQNPGDSGLPTALQWQLPQGVAAADILWPLPRKLRLGELVNYGFEGEVTLVAPLRFDPAFRPPADGLLRIGLTAHWLVCRTECIPQTGEFQLQVPWGQGQSQIAPSVSETLARQPQVFPGQASARIESEFLLVQAQGWPAEAQGQKIGLYPERNEVIAAPAEQHPRAQIGWQNGVYSARLPLSDLRSESPAELSWWWVVGEGPQARAWRVITPVQGPWPPLPQPGQGSAPILKAEGADLGFWGALLGAFLGGLLLNLMPCVLPVLALKMFALGQGQISPVMRRWQGWSYTLGVLVFLLALGAGLLALRAAGQAVGWGFQLQSPWVVGALALLFALIALNLADWIHVERWFSNGMMQWQSRHPAVDAFLTGLLSVVVAAPCSAPFMGASLGLAVTLPWSQALSVFAVLGVGLASPYLLACHFPAVVRFIPRPGAWMNRLRHLLAIPMAATVVWLLWVLGQQLTAPEPGPASGAVAVRADSPAGQWLPWSPEVVAQAQAQGRIVMVDFTAAWCITCQVNKRTTLERPELLQALKDKNVLVLRADWTRHDPVITQALSDLDRTGIPAYAIYRPGLPARVLSELISVSDVLDALR